MNIARTIKVSLTKTSLENVFWCENPTLTRSDGDSLLVFRPIFLPVEIGLDPSIVRSKVVNSFSRCTHSVINQNSWIDVTFGPLAADSLVRYEDPDLGARALNRYMEMNKAMGLLAFNVRSVVGSPTSSILLRYAHKCEPVASLIARVISDEHITHA